MQAFSEVFLIDHALTFRLNDLRKLLASNPEALTRLSTVCKYGDKKKSIPTIASEEKGNIEFDYQEISDPLTLDIPEDCVSLSLYGNQISDISLVKELISKLKFLKSLWLNENPLPEEEVNKLPTEFPNLELLNSQFTKNSSEWAIKFTSCGMNLSKTNVKKPENLRILDFSGRNIRNLNSTMLSSFTGVRKMVIKDESILEKDLPTILSLCQQLPKLREIVVDDEMGPILFSFAPKISEVCKKFRFINGFEVSSEEIPSFIDFQLETQIKKAIPFINSYRLVSSEKYDESSVWFLMDELGSAFLHTDSLNFKVFPFLYAPNNKFDDSVMPYSIAWPIKNIKSGELLTRDFLCGVDEEKRRSARLSVWFDTPKNYFIALFKQQQSGLNAKRQMGKFVNSSLDQYKNTQELPSPPSFISSKETLKIVTDSYQLLENLESGRYSFTEVIEEADIVWKEKDAEFTESPNYLINQFPAESCITFKNNLFKLVQSALGNVNWLPTTYDLDTNADGFVGHFLYNQSKGKDNSWIVKPVNMARSIDSYVTTSCEKVLRLMETGSKIVQKYIHRPLTTGGHKLDFRMLMLLRSTDPLIVYIYNDFWVRKSYNPLTLDCRSFEVYETHFTVMNYKEGMEKKPAYSALEFLEDFSKEYGIEKWTIIWDRVLEVVRELAFSIKNKQPQMTHSNSRAMYGLDFMVDKPKLQPLLLEVTFQPDCIRAAKGIPTFFEDILDTLYRDKPNENVLRVI